MITNSTLEKLEFPKVLLLIARYASTELGKKQVLEIRPFESLFYAEQEGKYVSEAKEVLIRNDFPPLTFIPNLHEILSLSRIEGTAIDSKSFLELLNLIVTSRNLFQFIKTQNEAETIKKDFLQNLFVDKVIEHHISKVIDENGEVRENASPKLKEIREEVRRKSDSLQKVINRILKELSDSYLVREEYVTQRDGRIVVPVKSEHKRHVKGFIHSESATGQTVYIEPEETLELNNEILSLYFAEKREVERILKELTKRIGENSEQLKRALDTIASVDCIFARAKYSLEIIGSFPSLDGDKDFKLIEARHPLLIKKLGKNSTIPLDINIDGKTNIILITGPNAGGKTVVLKAMGILSLMVASGIHIPASPDSNLHFFKKILLDIGDEQSIEDDLSTFSSHLSNIKRIITDADKDSLVLLDEIGTGTDPAEGAALASSTLLTLRDKRATVLATTHHGGLKLIANELEGFQNASMEFDSDKIVPTYKFQQGLPGSSYAFEVAERIGFSKNFLNLAKQYLDTDKMKVEEFLIELEKRSKKLQQKLDFYERENTRLKGLTNIYKQNIDKLEEQKKIILHDAKVKAEEFIKDVNKKVETAIKEIKEKKADKEIIRQVKQQVTTIKDDISNLVQNDNAKKEKVKKVFIVGENVKLNDSDITGKITELNAEKETAVVTAGNIKLKVKFDEIEHVTRKEIKEAEKQATGNYKQQAEYRIDIRGQKPEEAEFEIIRFLDNAYSYGLGRVEILHGKGTGVLKKLVKDILIDHPGVSKYYFANIESGGDGITIVEFK